MGTVVGWVTGEAVVATVGWVAACVVGCVPGWIMEGICVTATVVLVGQVVCRGIPVAVVAAICWGSQPVSNHIATAHSKKIGFFTRYTSLSLLLPG